MDISDLGILLLISGLLVGSAMGWYFIFLPELQQDTYEVRQEEIIINNVEFKGTSGLANNSIILFVENNNRVMNVVVKQVNVLGDSFNRTFSIIPEENNYPTKSQGQITLTNVGWMKNIEYKIYIISSNGMLCGAIHIIA